MQPSRSGRTARARQADHRGPHQRHSIEELTVPTAKQAAQEVIDQLPDRIDMEEIMYRLYVLDKIRKG